MEVVLAYRWNLDINIPDLAWIIMTDLIVGVFTTAFFTIPVMSLFAKVIPERIEATMFAFLEGALNFDMKVIRPMIGTLLNYEFVGVDKDDQSGWTSLTLIKFGTTFIGFALVFLIPLKRDIQKTRLDREM